MAKTIHTPKNPQLHRPVTALGKDVQLPRKDIPQPQEKEKNNLEKEEKNLENLFHIRC